MKLYIDIGNSRTKLVEDNNGFGEVTSILNNADSLYASLSACLESTATPDQIVVSNVGGKKLSEIVTEVCEKKMSISPLFLEVDKDFGAVRNGYVQYHQLGIDRWVAIIAAWNMYKCNIMIVDCGSVITVDMVLDSGEHQGGYIIPGNRMMMQALMKNTSKILVANSDISTGLPGRSTKECVTNGSIEAVISFIESKSKSLDYNSDKPYRCIITGGGADVLLDRLSIPHEYIPLLVFEGMKIINEASP